MDSIEISAKNNFNVPVRLTLISEGKQILIIVGEAGVQLGEYWRICIDTDLLPGQERNVLGALHIDTSCRTFVVGLENLPGK